jgi:hypothetical protein
VLTLTSLVDVPGLGPGCEPRGADDVGIVARRGRDPPAFAAPRYAGTCPTS